MNKKKRILVACEYSGTVRDAFTKRGCPRKMRKGNRLDVP